jgi:uncharacterized damage-inducible protein DinB
MTDPRTLSLLEPLLDSWDRSDRILVNLLRALPEGGLEAAAGEGSPTVAQLFTHMHYVRLAFVEDNVPEHAVPLPPEWVAETEPDRIAGMLAASAGVVRQAVESRVTAGRDMDLHFDHPILLLQHLVWHEAYHHGQIKLALKAAGLRPDDREIARGTWGVWMRKTQGQ